MKAEIKGVRRWIIMRVLGRMRVVPAERRVRGEFGRQRGVVEKAWGLVKKAWGLVEELYGVRGNSESTEMDP